LRPGCASRIFKLGVAHPVMISSPRLGRDGRLPSPAMDWQRPGNRRIRSAL